MGYAAPRPRRKRMPGAGSGRVIWRNRERDGAIVKGRWHPGYGTQKIRQGQKAPGIPDGPDSAVLETSVMGTGGW